MSTTLQTPAASNGRSTATALDRFANLTRIEDSEWEYRADCPCDHEHGGEQKLTLKVAKGDQWAGDRLVVYCHKGCSPRQIADALALTSAQVYVGTTLRELAEYTHLPETVLTEYGWSDTESGVRMAYPKGSRTRLHIGSDEQGTRFRWAKGDHANLYGANWKLSTDWFVLVEGETDTVTMRYAKIPARGLPGKDVLKCIEQQHVDGMSRIYVFVEPNGIDVTKLRRHLDHLGRKGELRAVTAEQLGAKDPSDLWKSDPDVERFRAAIEKCLAASTIVPAAPKLRLNILRASDVTPKAVDWLWQHRIALGKINLVVGDPGDGKSFLTMALAAKITNGWPMPLDPTEHKPANVLIMNFEDGIEDTLRPRADLCGANLERVLFAQTVLAADDEELPFTASHISLIGEHLEADPEIRMVVIDPLASILGSVDTHRDNEVRASLQPLVICAAKYNVAVVCVMHLNKTDAEKILYRIGGSIGFGGLPRSALLVAQRDGRRSVSSLKHNLSAEAEPVEFTIADNGVTWGTKGAPELSAAKMLAPKERILKVDQAEDWLRDQLASGDVRRTEIDERAKQAGISIATLRRVIESKKSPFKSERRGMGADGAYYVTLKPDPANPDEVNY